MLTGLISVVPGYREFTQYFLIASDWLKYPTIQPKKGNDFLFAQCYLFTSTFPLPLVNLSCYVSPQRLESLMETFVKSSRTWIENNPCSVSLHLFATIRLKSIINCPLSCQHFDFFLVNLIFSQYKVNENWHIWAQMICECKRLICAQVLKQIHEAVLKCFCVKNLKRKWHTSQIYPKTKVFALKWTRQTVLASLSWVEKVSKIFPRPIFPLPKRNMNGNFRK